MIHDPTMKFAYVQSKHTDPPLGTWATGREASMSALARSRGNKAADATGRGCELTIVKSRTKRKTMFETVTHHAVVTILFREPYDFM